MSIKSTGKLKKEALIQLKSNWGIAILVSFIAILFTDGVFYLSNINEFREIIANPFYYKSIADDNLGTTVLFKIGVLIKLLIGGCITCGLYNFFLNLLRKNNPKVENVLSGFKFFGKNFLIQLVIYIFTFLWTIVIYIPASIILLIIAVSNRGNFYTLDMISLGSSIAIILMMISLIIAAYILIYIAVARYEMAFFIANDNPELACMECIKASKEMMDGNCVRYFLLNLTFIGWEILSILTLGLGYLWLRPYKYAVKANFYMNLKDEDISSGDIAPKYKNSCLDDNSSIKDEFKEI